MANPKTKAEYWKKLNPDWSDERCTQEAVKIKRQSNYQCIEYWQAKYPDATLEECETIMATRKAQKKTTNPFNVEYWKKLNPDWSDERCRLAVSVHAKKNNYQCIEYWQAKYPDATLEECGGMMANAIQKALNKRPDNSGENNPAHHSKTTELQRKQRSPLCIEFWEKKYPNKTPKQREKLWTDHCKKIQTITSDHKIQPTCWEYWVENGYTKEDAIIKVSEIQKSKAFTLEKCIKKYGEVEGPMIFEARQVKWQKSLHNTLNNGSGLAQSMIAIEFFKKLIADTKIRKYQFEYQLGRYSFDFRYNKILIEFNGDYWHCNPKIYEPNFYNKVIKKTAYEIWTKDKRKLDQAIKKGYNVMTVWEFDFNQNPEKTIQKCIDFINENS